MAEFQRVVNWTAPDASARVNQLARERITSYVTDYLARGNDALSSQSDCPCHPPGHLARSIADRSSPHRPEADLRESLL
jgi:hypothetical protein